MMNCGLHKVEGLVYDNGCELSFIKKMKYLGLPLKF